MFDRDPNGRFYILGNGDKVNILLGMHKGKSGIVTRIASSRITVRLDTKPIVTAAFPPDWLDKAR